MSKLVYRHDRAGYTGELRFSITSDAEYGAVGTQGVGAARNLPDGLIDAQGYARSSAGGDYVMAGAVPGVNVLPAMHRLTVRRGSTPIASVSFQPVETSPGTIDVIQLVQSGGALAITPEQLANIGDLGDLSEIAQKADSAQEVAGTAQILAALPTKYVSTGTANPATPTQAERDAYAAAHPEQPWLPGSRRTAAGGVQALRDSAAGWVVEGSQLASTPQLLAERPPTLYRLDQVGTTLANLLSTRNAAADRSLVDLGGSTTTATDLTADMSKVRRFGNGKITGTSNTVLTVTGAPVPYDQTGSVIENLEIAGTRAGTYNLLRLGTPASTGGGASSAHVTLRNLILHDAQYGVLFGEHSYLQAFEKVNIYNCDTCIAFNSGFGDSGERISVHGTLFNSNIGVDMASGQINFMGSIDYCGIAVRLRGGAVLRMRHSHIESKWGDTWFDVADSNSALVIADSTLVIPSAPDRPNNGARTTPLGVCTSTDAGIVMRDVIFDNLPNWRMLYVIEGQATIKGITPYRADLLHPIGSTSMELFADYTFAAGNVSYDWAGFGNVAAIYVNQGVKHNGNPAAQIAAPLNQSGGLRKSTPVRVGDKPVARMWVKTQGDRSKLSIESAYYTATGVRIDAPTHAYTGATLPTDWTELSLTPFTAAPGAAAEWRLTLSINGSDTDGQTVLYVAEPHACVY